MASLTVRNVPDELVERVKETATRNGRSMEQELRALLQERFGARDEVLARIRATWNTLPRATREDVKEWIATTRSGRDRGV